MRMTQVASIFTSAVVATAVIAVYARAEQPTQAGSARPLVSANPASECQLSGKPSLPLDVIIYAKDKGDAKNARFTGMTTGLIGGGTSRVDAATSPRRHRERVKAGSQSTAG